MTTSKRLADEPPSRLTRFFLWCSGTDMAVLEKVPRSEIIRQTGFGTLVLIPAVLALFAMSYALSTLTESAPLYVAGGVIWAVIVFCFDRFIVSTFRKSASPLADVATTVFITRFLFAVFVGVIVAHPLVMLYFNDTIEQRLAADGRREVAGIEVGFEERRQVVDERISALKAEIRDGERHRDEYQAQLVDEIDGIVSGRTTGIPGRGASAEEKKLQLQQAQNELDAARERNLGEIAALQMQIGELRADGRNQVAQFQQSQDYLARAGALEALSRESPHVNTVKWFLILFFVFVDTLPILFKGFTPRGPYDERLQLVEFKAGRSIEARRDSVERVLYPYLVMESENRFLAKRNYKGVGDYAERYRDFLAEVGRHQEEFLAEWQRQQEILASLEDEDLRRTQLSAMEHLRRTSAEVVDKAVERFRRSLAWETSPEGGPAAEGP